MFLCTVQSFVSYRVFSFADIHNVFPSSGSLEGGTVVTIDGLGFSENPANVKVFVSGKFTTMSRMDLQVDRVTTSKESKNALFT